MNDKLRRQISYEAARLIYARQESEYHRAKLKAARLVVGGWVRPHDLPTNREVRDEIQTWARLTQHGRDVDLGRAMRVAALAIMSALRPFRPRLSGDALTGRVDPQSVIAIELLTDSVAAVGDALAHEGFAYEVIPLVGTATNLVAEFEVQGAFRTVLTMYRSKSRSGSSSQNQPGRATIGELEQLLQQESRDLEVTRSFSEPDGSCDRFRVYESLLLPLEHVKQSPKWHPEGDALYHSLQVFDLAREEIPYDEEFLVAALLHDVGKAIDPRDPIPSALEALDGYISPRTAWLMTHLPDAKALRDGTLGVRSRRRLEAHDSFEELTTLARCDRAGRQRGVQVPRVEEALDYLRELASACG